MRFLSGLRPATLVSLIALFVALGGTGYAVVNRGGTLHACANRKTGALRLARKCVKPRPGRPGERAVFWNQTGPAGPAGPSDEYYASTGETIPGSSSNLSLSIRVPPGTYAATAGCTAHHTAP